MKYRKKESGHEKKSPKGLVMIGYRGVTNTLQLDHRDEQT